MQKETDGAASTAPGSPAWTAIVDRWHRAMGDIPRFGDPDRILKRKFFGHPGFAWATLGVQAMREGDSSLLEWATQAVEAIRDALEAQDVAKRARRGAKAGKA